MLWHGRQGVLLAFTEVFVALALVFMGLFPIVGFICIRFLLPMWLMWGLGMSVTSILQACKGKRHKIPVIHQFMDYI
jgi:hypothetical protein